MTDDTGEDLRENLFSEFKDVCLRCKDLQERIQEHSTIMEALQKESMDLEREQTFLRRTLHLVLVEDCDPVLAKFKISDEMKNEPTEYGNRPSRLIAYVDDGHRRRGRMRRMIRACREIWNDR